MKRLLVLSDLDTGVDRSIDDAAMSLAIAMAHASIGLVCCRDPGPQGGLMRRVAATIQEHGGSVTSVTVAAPASEHGHADGTHDVLVTGDRHELKIRLSQLSHGLVVLPGRAGTLDIVMEYLTWLRGGGRARPVYVANVAHAWSALLEMFAGMNEQSFLPDGFWNRYIVMEDTANIVADVNARVAADERAPESYPQDGSRTTAIIPRARARQVCVFCGSSSGKDAVYAEAAARLGRAIAVAGLGLVYGGGKNGLMGSVAAAAMASGGSVTGIMPRTLIDGEQAFREISSFHEVGSYHQRKMHMCHLSDVFIALPGGPGTLEEVVEQLAWLESGYHTKPVVLVNTSGYWNPLVKLLAQMDDRMPPTQRSLAKVILVDRPEDAVEVTLALAHRTPAVD